MNGEQQLTDRQLLEIISLSNEPLAIYVGEEIIIQSANKAMLKSWGKADNLIGKSLLDALPEIKSQPLFAMLQNVWRTGINDVGKAIMTELLIDGKLLTFYFDYTFLAINDTEGKVYAILHTARDVTKQVLSRSVLQQVKVHEEAYLKEQAINAELSAANEGLFSTNEALYKLQQHLYKLNTDLENRVEERTSLLSKSEARLRYLIADAPIAIAVFNAKDLVIESANKKILEAWGKTSEIIGQPLYQAVPEIFDQDIFDQVFETGAAYFGNEVKTLMARDGKTEEVYSNLVYQPLKDETGNTTSVMLTANVITEQVVSRKSIQELNEELSAMNEELRESQERLLLSNSDLTSSEIRMDQILSEMPTPFVALLGPNHIISNPNNSILKLWKKNKEDIIGLPMLAVFPELKSQLFPGIWKHVFETGDKVTGREKPIYFNHENNEKQFYYIDYYYQPFYDLKGEIIGVLATVIDVTDKLEARKMVEQAETKLRLAIDSSQLGTWYIDAVTLEFTSSIRLKEIFGFYDYENFDYKMAIDLITDEYRDLVVKSFNDAIDKGEKFDMEYTIKSFHDGEIKWVRSTGKLYEADGYGSATFSGTIQDITERKLEEQRKDDFLSIASHELRTPITSLKGSLQLLNKFKENLSNPIVPKLVEQAHSSVIKITSLIDDLLNTTRANDGQLHLNRTNFAVSEMLTVCCNQIRMGGEHDLILQGTESLFVFADEVRIEQVVVNLVNNAAKYAPHIREIYLIMEDLGNRIKISVKDNGPGIPAEKIPHIFDRYYRADYGGIQYSGLGLGLYISAEIIKRHGGTIGVDSEIGKGSTFWFTIPNDEAFIKS